MDEDADDFDNLFDDYGENVADHNVPEKKNGNENETKIPEVVPVPKRIVRNPRIKFDAERLCSKRGIPVLVKHFEKVKFKGKGYEKEDLDKFLSSLQHWCHRLYPSMKFEDCLHQIEKLGKKRQVQTCLHKIRLDMPILADDFVSDDKGEEENHHVEEMEPDDPEPDAFDDLMSSYQRVSATNTHAATNTLVTEDRPSERSGFALTEEQRRKIELNKTLAMERRKSKLVAMNAGESSQTNVGATSLAETNNSLTSENLEDTLENASTKYTKYESSQLNFGETSLSEFALTNNSRISESLEDTLENASSSKYSEELEIDDLMNLVNSNETFDEKGNLFNETEKVES